MVVIHTSLKASILTSKPNVETTDWKVLTTGFTTKGDYDAATIYIPGDVVQYGGNTYVKNVTGPAGIAPNKSIDLNGNVVVRCLGLGFLWSKVERKLSNQLLINSMMLLRKALVYVSIIQDNLNIDPETDNGTNWQSIAQGESTLSLALPGDILIRNANANVPLAIGSEGEVLAVVDSGQVDAQSNPIYLPAWQRDNWCANVYYVATDGTDDPDYGKNISKPYNSSLRSCADSKPRHGR